MVYFDLINFDLDLNLLKPFEFKRVLLKRET